MIDQQTSRTNITEALREYDAVAADPMTVQEDFNRAAHEVVAAVRRTPSASDKAALRHLAARWIEQAKWDGRGDLLTRCANDLEQVLNEQTALASEPRSDAVTAPDEASMEDIYGFLVDRLPAWSKQTDRDLRALLRVSDEIDPPAAAPFFAPSPDGWGTGKQETNPYDDPDDPRRKAWFEGHQAGWDRHMSKIDFAGFMRQGLEEMGYTRREARAASASVPPLDERLRQARLFVIESVRQFVKDDPLGGGRERTLKFLDGIAFGEGRDDPDAFAAEITEQGRGA